MRILVVCKGNMARSPMLEAVLKREFERAGKKGFVVESAGTLKGAQARYPLESGAAEALQKGGFKIPGHRSRWVGDVEARSFDKILCMTPRIKAFLVGRLMINPFRVSVVCADDGGVPDPCGESQEAYDKVLESLKKFATQFVNEL